jgi:hypothetical protein
MAKAAVTVRIKGIKELLADVETLDQLKPLHRVLVDASRTAQETAQANSPTFSGGLRRSFVTEIEPLSARVSTPLGYARIMEFGRRPGGKQPPPNALRAWATAHGIANTFVLARSIGKRGLKGRFFRRKARAAVRRQMPGLLDRMAREMEGDWGR